MSSDLKVANTEQESKPLLELSTQEVEIEQAQVRLLLAAKHQQALRLQQQRKEQEREGRRQEARH